MNTWIRSSIELANRDSYLDNLLSVYDVSAVSERQVSADHIKEITNAHVNRDAQGLMDALLKLDKFPIDDIHIGFLRNERSAIAKNPITVKRIVERLLSMKVHEVLGLCLQPKVDNRRMGELFHNWFKSLNYPKLDLDNFSRLTEAKDAQGKRQHVLTLDGTRKGFRDFVNDELGCGLEKELDILVKVRGQYIIGEAKYFSNYGGNQSRQFDDATNFLLNIQGDASRIAVLDGVVWLDTNDKICRGIRKVESIALSALLLQDFFEKIQT
jgi:hypothetical protein